MQHATAWIRRATWALIVLHGFLLAATIPDYFPNIDHAYHAALARQYAENGAYPWDYINWGPEGRPNLQGPLLHYAIAALGLLLGGSGDAYVLALSVWAFLQWAAAVWTAYFFARRFGGDRAALFAAALLTGSLFAAGAFFVGLPSGWIFILTAWAIHFFLEGHIPLSILFTTAAIYVHLGGISTAPLGVLVAAILARRWRRLLAVGAVTAVLAAPLIFHFLRYLAWYRGQRGHVAFMSAPLVYCFAVPGLLRLARHPRRHVFLLAWAAAPAAWIWQDAIRFLLQSTLAGAVIGGLFAAWLWERLPRWRTAYAAAVVAVATLAPLSIPSLALEGAWFARIPIPRQIEWKEVKAIAEVIRRDRLNGRLLAIYNSSLGDAVAVFTPVAVQNGHWVEVQPRDYSARRLPAATKVYVLPLAPGDAQLRDLEARGLVRVHGGSARMAVVTLERRASPQEAAPLAGAAASSEAAWLSRHAVNNRIPPALDFFSTAFARRREATMRAQRSAAGRIETATLIYAYALEPSDPDAAASARGAAGGFGSIANFLGDGNTIDMMSDARHQRLRENFATLAAEARKLSAEHPVDPSLGSAIRKLFGDYF